MSEQDGRAERGGLCPLETSRGRVLEQAEDSYRIASAARLPRIRLTSKHPRRSARPAAVGSARARPGAARHALRQAQGHRRRHRLPSRSIPLPAPGCDAGEPAFQPRVAPPPATTALQFDCPAPRRGRARAPARPALGVVAWHGRWYLVGLDLDRARAGLPALPRRRQPEADRPGQRLRAAVGRRPRRRRRRSGRGEEHLVVVRARPGTAVGLRRFARPWAGRRR